MSFWTFITVVTLCIFLSEMAPDVLKQTQSRLDYDLSRACLESRRSNGFTRDEATVDTAGIGYCVSLSTGSK